VYGAPDYGPPAPAPARRGTVSWVGLFIALIGTVGVGVAGWACLATIQFTVTPFEIAQWWFIVLIVASVLPIVALIVCIAGLVMGRSRLVAVVGIIIAVIAPAVSVGTGLTLGTNTLINRAGEAAANSSDLVTDMFDGADVDPWVRDLLNSLQTYSEGYH
jgi:hypothetical protein